MKDHGRCANDTQQRLHDDKSQSGQQECKYGQRDKSSINRAFDAGNVFLSVAQRDDHRTVQETAQQGE